MSKSLFLLGNGLSIALSPDFALRNITMRFIESLTGYEKEFLLGLCSKGAGISFDDFEHNFTFLEASFDSLRKYRLFIESDIGQKFRKQFNLSNPDLLKHEEIIEKIYRGYISRILEIIHGNVHKSSIENYLKNFVAFLTKQIEGSEKTYVFTLNYDLLVEAILLEYLSTEYFTDFCFPSGYIKDTDISKYDFNPKRNADLFKESNKKVELHHLHGSLSLFYDYERNRAIKLRSLDIGYEGIYEKIYEDKLPLVPAIITGGGKSDKIVQYPFDFYFRSMKDICDFGEVSKLFIVGYSFRDEHINDLIKRWMKNVKDYTKGMLIVDYRVSNQDKDYFKSFVRSTISKRPPIPDDCFEFGGAEAIHDIQGTEKKD